MGWRRGVFRSARFRPTHCRPANALPRRGAQSAPTARGGRTRTTLFPEQNRERLSLSLRILVGWSSRPIDRRAMRGDAGMKAVFFCHAYTSCWNNGNAHFLRGVTRELARLGHQIMVCEPSDGWSRINAQQAGGASAILEAAALVPGVKIHSYVGLADLEEVLHGA